MNRVGANRRLDAVDPQEILKAYKKLVLARDGKLPTATA
jgi:hypothetical protein